jgi:hypothetical protein
VFGPVDNVNIEDGFTHQVYGFTHPDGMVSPTSAYGFTHPTVMVLPTRTGYQTTARVAFEKRNTRAHINLLT